MKYLLAQPFLAAAALLFILHSTQILIAQEPDLLRASRAPISEAEIVAAQQFGQTLSIAEWLGPMAPVALSPFFGITCLSGMSLFGANWISPGNPLMGENSPLHNPAVFWTFLALTIATSVPRLAKVSKPFAQALDQLEAWSGIITMLVMKVLLSSQSDVEEVTIPVAQMGLIRFSMDVVLMIAAAINILVINAVKFFFEVLIWVTPVPFLDAVFEFSNKAVCVALMALYAWSPSTAAAVNAVMFFVCFMVFGWIWRSEIFFRTMLLEFFRSQLGRSRPGTSLVVFPVSAVGPIKARAKCFLRRSDNGWQLVYEPWFRRTVCVEFAPDNRPLLKRGLISNQICMTTACVTFTFGRLHNDCLPDLAVSMNLVMFDDGSSVSTVNAEFV